MTRPAHVSSWAPFKHAAFTMLWFAQLGSNLGSWMQTVGAQWFLVDHSHSAALVAWVQTASQAPVLLLSLLAGVLADEFRRRWILVVMNAGAAATAIVLFLLTASGLLGPAGLLTATFALGCFAAINGPAWQAIQPELVPRAEIPAAASLGSVTVNGARVVGPALAGGIIAVAGPAPVFALNGVSFVGVVVALLIWREPARRSRGPREPFLEAISAGLRYMRSAPGPRRVLLRCALFAVPASAFWALLPTVAGRRLGLDAGGYGLLLGAVGLGSVAGLLVMPLLRRRLNASQLLAVSAIAFALGTVATAVAPLWLVLSLLIPTGAGWIATLTTVNATLQLAVADWVRARALSVYFLVFIGGQGIASFAWGLVAEWIGSVATLMIGAALLVAVAISIRWLPILPMTDELDRAVTPVSADGPAMNLDVPDSTPVMVRTDYTVAESDAARFEAVMQEVGLSRRRRGAYLWRLDRASDDVTHFVEEYRVRSVDELRRGDTERRTGFDAAVVDAVQQWRTADSEWLSVSLPQDGRATVLDLLAHQKAPGGRQEATSKS